MTRLQEMLKEFHTARGDKFPDAPTIPGPKELKLRALLICEEFFEFLDALGVTTSSPERTSLTAYLRDRVWNPSAVDLAAVADALADMDYVNEGSRQAFGIDGGPIAEEVHSKNMSKNFSQRTAEGKTVKPLDWQPPNIMRLLREQGWGNGKAKAESSDTP